MSGTVMPYNPANWYWIVAGSTTQVWSSARVQYVPLTDATYEAWLAAGNLPTRILDEAELQAVLAAQYPAGWPQTAQQIAQAAYAALIANGLTITSTGTPAISGVYPIDPQSQSDLAVEAQFISTFAEFTNGGTTGLSWFLLNGSTVTFPTTAAFLNVAKVAAQTVAAGKLAAGQGTAMPSASVTIP